MKIHGKYKASITVETAFVLPVVLGALFVVLVIVLNMFQNATQLAVLNMNALYGANLLRDTHITDLEQKIITNTQSNLDIIQILKLDAESVATDSSSLIIRGKMTTLDASAIGIPKQVWQTSGIASIINPSQYIRETDGKYATLIAGTAVWDDEPD